MQNLFFFLFFYVIGYSFAQDAQSPYLQLATPDAHIPLKESYAQVDISGTVAHVKLTQVYQNLGDEPIAAQYIFPLATKAAVHRMEMKVGERIVRARIFEKEEAQKVYETAVNAGKRAAKLDQHRPNVFQMNVGNIMPQDIVSIHIYYTELLQPRSGRYQFVAPGVVGPRYTGESTANSEVFHAPYTPEGTADTFTHDIQVTINAGMMLQHVGSSSHDINTAYPNPRTATVTLSGKNRNPANRDFILDYSLRGNAIESGLLLYEHGNENFFTYIMEPPAKVRHQDIPSREYLFVVDVSGSMNGYPLAVARALMRNLLCNLKATDTFNVQLFASSSTVFSPHPLEAYEENIEAAIHFLSEGQGGGGTQLLNALGKAYSMPRKDPNGSRSMVIITDGYVSVEKEAFDLIRNHLDQANVFTFGIGSSVNRHLIEGMAKVSQSESFVATDLESAHQVAQQFKAYIATPVLTQIKLETKGFDVYDVSPKTIPDVFAQRPVVVHGKYRGKPQGSIRVKGYLGKQKFKQEFPVSQGQLSPKNKALRYLWARNRIATLDDYGKLFYESQKDSVVQLGLTYNLATAYTSFVAVDEIVANPDGTLRKRIQPLPMPQNVSNLAVGAEAGHSEKVRFRKSFAIQFDQKLSARQKREFTLKFRAIYAQWVKQALQQNSALRIHWDAQGKLLKIEKLHYGKWVAAPVLEAAFSQLPDGEFKLSQALVITLTR